MDTIALWRVVTLIGNSALARDGDLHARLFYVTRLAVLVARTACRADCANDRRPA
jgi:hypothetical protein